MRVRTTIQGVVFLRLTADTGTANSKGQHLHAGRDGESRKSNIRIEGTRESLKCCQCCISVFQMICLATLLGNPI